MLRKLKSIKNNLIDYLNENIAALEDIAHKQQLEIEQWKEEANKYQNLWCEAVMKKERITSISALNDLLDVEKNANEKLRAENEIMKALECCIQGDQCAYSCPYDDEEADCNKCTSALAKDTLDLINRSKQQLADERATAEIAAETISRQDAEIERLQGLLKEWKKAGYKYADSIDRIKIEAIKEFAEMYEMAIEQLLKSATIEQSYVIYECLDKFKALSYRECTKGCHEIPKELEEMVSDDNG